MYATCSLLSSDYTNDNIHFVKLQRLLIFLLLLKSFFWPPPGQKDRNSSMENFVELKGSYSHHRRGRCSMDRVAEGVTVADDGHRPPQ